jgi:hypothetical protein
MTFPYHTEPGVFAQRHFPTLSVSVIRTKSQTQPTFRWIALAIA